MYCSKCGSQIADGSRFCSFCGAPVEAQIVSQEPEYEDGSGIITFNDDGTFTWHEDQSDSGNDMVFEWVPVTE